MAEQGTLLWRSVLAMYGCWLLAAMFNVNIIVNHIRGRDNSIADLLSRWHLTVHNTQELHHLVENPVWTDTHIDLTLLNHDI